MTESRQEVAVETGETEEWIGEVDDKKAVGVKGSSKTAQGSGLTAAGLTGEQPHAALLGQIVEASAQFVLPLGGEEIGRGDIFAKRDTCKTVKVLDVHFFSGGSLVKRKDPACWRCCCWYSARSRAR